MPSCLPQSNGLSREPPFDDNKYLNDDDLDMSNETDGGTSLIDEQKRATQESIMMQDLGSCIRDWITRSDFSRPPNVSLRQLQRDRAVEDPGSEANKAYVENKKKINGWNNLHVELKNDGGAEKLDTMMDGQSHRAKLREIVVNTGGQRYDPYGSDDPPDHSSRSRAIRGSTISRGGRGGGMVGTRGRGASTSHGRPITFGSVTNRPLDPAIDPKDPRSKYRSGRGSAQSGRGSQQANRSPASVISTSRRGLGSGGKAQDVRATIVGTTVQVTAASARPPQARQPEPSSKWAHAASAVNHNPRKPMAVKPAPPARIPSVLQDSDGILDPKRFLAALAATTDRERFNKMVPSQPKLAPASRAAKIVAKSSEKVEKTFDKLIQSTPKPALPPKVGEMVANLNLLKKDSQKTMNEPEARKFAPEKQVLEGKADEVNAMARTTATKPEPGALKPEGLTLEEMAPANMMRPKLEVERPKVQIPSVVKPTQEEEEQRLEERKGIRQIPTHEFVFPPPFSKSNKSFGELDAWTDGVLTPQTPNFSASTENSPAIGFAKVMGEDIARAAARASSATLRTATPVVGLSISSQSSSAPELRANIETDLLMLESEEVVGHGSTYVSGAVVDLMDLDFNDTPQESLTPCFPGPVQGQKPESSAAWKEHPLCVKIDGIRYFREDRLAHAILPEEATGNTAIIPVVSANSETTGRVITENGYTIGVHHLGLHNGNLLGDHNLAQRPEENSTPCDLDSIWADRPAEANTRRREVRAVSPARVDHQHKLETLIQRDLSLDPRPSAIGERHHPGRLHLVSQDTPAIPARGSPQAEDRGIPRSVQHPQGASMPRTANPWNSGRSVASTKPRPSGLTESKWGEANTRDATNLSQRRADGPSNTRTMARSFKTTPSSLSGDSVFSCNEALRSFQNDFCSSTSEDAGLSSVRPIRGVAEQQDLSENFDVVSENSPVQETEAEQMVRMMRSQGSAGLTRFPIAHPTNETREGRCSVSSATNLNISKWAAEGTAMSLPTIRPSAKPAEISSRDPSAKASNTQFMRQDGKTRTTIVRTNAGPGYALLMAEATSGAASSDSPSTATNNRATSKAPVIESESGTASHTATAQSLDTLNDVAKRTMASEPRVRVINQPRPLCQNAGLAKVQRGRGDFQNGNSNHDGSDSDISEL